MMESKLNVFQKLIEVKKFAKSFKKDGKGYGYSYITLVNIYNKTTDKMNDIGLLVLIMSSKNRASYQFKFKNEKGDEKTDFVLEGEVTYALVNADNPDDRWVIPFEYFGQQSDISQAFGSGMTYAIRTMLTLVLGLPTDENDPNRKPESQRPASESKYDKINKLLKGTKFVMDDVNKWILIKHAKPIRVNDLSDEQFNELYDALAAKIMEQ